MDLARKIQQDFLPQELPALTGWEMAVLFQPAIEVAGDFYDVFMLPNGKTGFVIADVSGKSMGAALFMALARSLLRALSQTTHAADPLGAISYVNEYIIKNHRGPGRLTMFVTLFYGLIDQETGELTYINAGHPPPVIAKNGRVRSFLNPTGPAIGIQETPHYTIGSERLLSGDMLFAYTDGVTEAQGPAGVLLGKDSLYKVLERSLFAPQSMIDSVSAEIAVHSGGGTASDDITMLALKRI
jgi:phosphoserine phosphatase RsbU/P